MKKQVNALVKKLQEKNLSIALAESMTCGMATQKLSTCKGTSDVLAGSIICYTPRIKQNLMGISKNMIDTYTCESMEVTEALVKSLSKKIDADILVAVTGLASEGASEGPGKPVGTVFICFSYKKRLHRLRKQFRGTPQDIRKKACIAIYEFILSKI